MEPDKTVDPEPVIGPGYFFNCVGRYSDREKHFFSSHLPVKVIASRAECVVFVYRVLRPIAAYPAAAVQR